MKASDFELEETVVPRKRLSRREVPPLIAKWKNDAAIERAGWFRKWASSQVAGYRLELMFGYLGMMFFGWTAIIAGFPLFKLTTPDPYGWAVIVGTVILVGGLIGGIGATRAGEEPMTRTIRIFNRIELVAATGLFLAIGLYAVSLLIYGYKIFPDPGRQTIGAAMTALAVRPGVRMMWLFFRPGKLTEGIVAGAIQTAISKRTGSRG